MVAFDSSVTKVNGDQRLWRAVLLQAIVDATTSARTDGGRHSDMIGRDKRHARDWLTEPNEDFDAVCALAELEPHYVRRLAIRFIAQADNGSRPKPKQLATIKRKPNERVRTLTYEGQTLPLSAWAKSHGVSYFVLNHRLNRGWSAERALTTPVAPPRWKRRTSGKAPGVVTDFPEAAGTGAGKHARDCAQIGFFDSAEGTPCP